MLYSQYSTAQIICICVTAFCWLVSAGCSVLLAALATFYCFVGYLSATYFLVSIMIALFFASGSFFALRNVPNSSRKQINRAFWTNIPRYARWLKPVPTTLFLGVAFISICFLIAYLDTAWHFVTHRIVPEFVAAHTPDLSELTHLDVSRLSDILLDASLSECLAMLAFIAVLLKVLIPAQLRCWNRQLALVEDDFSKIHLLDLMTTANLFIKNVQAAEESSSLMMKLTREESLPCTAEASRDL